METVLQQFLKVRKLNRETLLSEDQRKISRAVHQKSITWRALIPLTVSTNTEQLHDMCASVCYKHIHIRTHIHIHIHIHTHILLYRQTVKQ